ncbi:MAG: YihY/virulence factor BrkB family protein [Gemmatimonadota bacterium]
MTRHPSRHDRLWLVCKAAFDGWWNHNVPRMGAALAYYTLFALAPVLIVVIAVGGAAFGTAAVRSEIVGQIQQLIGKDGAQTVQAMLEAAGKSSPQLIVTIIGIVTFVLGATGAFLELQSDLDAIWCVKPKNRGSVLRELLIQRLISIGLVLGFAFVLLTALVLSAALAAISSFVGTSFPGAAEFWTTADLAASLGVISLLFAMIYKVMPDVDLAWRDVWFGAVVTAVLFTIGKSVIGLYLGASVLTSTYGAAGSVIVILVWVYYSSQILLLGAAFTKAHVDEFRGTPKPSLGAIKTEES